MASVGSADSDPGHNRLRSWARPSPTDQASAFRPILDQQFYERLPFPRGRIGEAAADVQHEASFLRVKRIGYVGVRTPEMERMTWFFRDVLGLGVGYTDQSYTVTHLPSGRFDFAEVYAPDHRDPRMIPNDVDGIVVSFIVDDLKKPFRGAL